MSDVTLQDIRDWLNSVPEPECLRLEAGYGKAHSPGGKYIYKGLPANADQAGYIMPTTMTVYRIQHRRLRVGPYHAHWHSSKFSELSASITSASDLDSGVRPYPYLDGIPYSATGGDLWFGFKSRGQLMRWFRGWESELEEHGFVVAIYRNAEVVGHGQNQLTFRKKRASKLVPISEFIAT